MKIKTLVIGLLIDRIDVLLCAGASVIDGRRIALPLEQDAAKWPRQVRDAAKAVRDAAGDMGARGLHARVFYRGPTAVAEYTSPRVRSPRDAAGAAILACADSLSCPLDAAAARATVIHCEKGEQAKAHVIVAADGDDALTAIREMIEEAGLVFASATPLDAALMARAARQAASPENTAPVALLYIGEHRSFLAVAVGSRLTFARPISVGLDSLVNSLTRPLRLAGGQTLELSREKAREIIHTCGFPSRSQVVDSELELTGGQIVPLLQPALQRCMVEVRQSLRFALPENQRLNVTLKVLGPGARTPGFTQIAADELGVPVDADERSRAFDYGEPASTASELADAIEDRKANDLALEPQAVSRSRRLTTMKRWLWTGAAAALAMIAFDAFRFHSRLTQVREQVEALHTQTEGLQALKATADCLLATSSAMTTLENTIRRETGAQAYMGAALQELSRLTPPSIRLGNIAFKPGTEGLTGTISGFAADDATSPTTRTSVLESYIQQLAQSPLFDRLALSNVQATMTYDQPTHSFDVSFTVVAAPVEIVSAVDIDSSGGSLQADATNEASAVAGGTHQ